MVDFAGGSGTSGDPYLIATPEQLREISAWSSSTPTHFALISDIDCTSWGVWTAVRFNYNVLDGRGHKIHGMLFDDPNIFDAGLFTALLDGALIRRVHVDVSFATSDGTAEWKGALTRYLRAAELRDVIVTGGILANGGGAPFGVCYDVGLGGSTLTRCIVAMAGSAGDAVLYPRDPYQAISGVYRIGYLDGPNATGAPRITGAAIGDQASYPDLDFVNTWEITPVGPRLRIQQELVTISGGTSIKSSGVGSDAVLLINAGTNQVAAAVTPDPTTGGWSAQVPPGDYYQMHYAGSCEPYCDGPYVVAPP